MGDMSDYYLEQRLDNYLNGDEEEWQEECGDKGFQCRKDWRPQIPSAKEAFARVPKPKRFDCDDLL